MLASESPTWNSFGFFPLFSHDLIPVAIAHLGRALFNRYSISRKEDELLAAIPLLTEALLSLGPEAARLFPIAEIFYKLACSILTLPLGTIDSLQVLRNLTMLLANKVKMGAEIQSDLAEEVVRILQMFAIRDPSSHIGPIAQNCKVSVRVGLETGQFVGAPTFPFRDLPAPRHTASTPLPDASHL